MSGSNGNETSIAAFVVGMHRSGTSGVARVVNFLGVPLNVPADWLPEAPQNNPAGFWESASLLRVNEEILAKLDGSWLAPPRLEGGWPANPRLDELRTTAAAACNAVFPTKQWVWKDPRNCLTLPFWLDVLDVRPAIVVVYRSPVEVALSLLRRDALAVNHSLALWERYVRSSLEAAAGLPAYVLDYARLLGDPIGSAADLHKFLASAGFEVVEPDEATLRSFLSSDLRHSIFPDPATWPQFGVSLEQCVLHEALCSAAGPHEALAVSGMGSETLATEALFRRLRVEREAARTLEANATSLRKAQERLTALTRAVELIETLVAELAKQKEKTAGLTAELAALRERAAVLEHHVDALEKSTALRLLTAPGRLRSQIRQRARNRPRAATDDSPLI